MRLIDADALLEEMKALSQSKDIVPEEDFYNLVTNAPTVAQDSEPILYAVQGYKEALKLHNGATLCTEKQDDLHTLPLYTSPPKREWRGLSDEEVSLMAFNDDEGDSNDLCFCGCWKRGYLNGVKAIEAKLKELNHD